ncbi:transposable element Tc1 transposase [Trichonephila clavipes]|nr:transposable element Tc1 transposase [Trichonephila clavipes]
MPLRRRYLYQQLTEFERGHILELRKGGFSLHYIAERLGRNVSTMHNCSWQYSQESAISRKPKSNHARLTTGSENCHIHSMAMEHRIASAAQII